MTDPISLDGRVALVTGAGRPTGIGFVAASIMQGRGARVAIASTTDRIHDRASELGGDAAGFVADLTDADAARRMVADVEARFGRLDLLVNNAGMVSIGQEVGDDRLFSEIEDEAWDRSIAMNLTTCYNVCRSTVPGMIARGYGRIVNVSSVTGPYVTNPASAAYSTAKAGMDGLTRGIAIEVAAKGITVNSVAPGWIASGSQTPEEIAAGKNSPIGRSGTSEEVGHLIAFLASDAASYITGQSIVVDGGNMIQEYKGPSDVWY
jgi:3-oxoacyl-[acyl-carrier protein] reductase